MYKYDLLIIKFLDNTISKDERKVLEDWILESDSNMSFFKKCIKNSGKQYSIYFDSDAAYRSFCASVKSKRTKKLLPSSIFKYAAILIILLTIGVFTKEIVLTDQQDTTSPIIVVDEDNNINENNVVITLSDGSTKAISSDGEDLVKDKKGNIIANKKENSLTLVSEDLSNSDKSFVEIFIPFGKTFQLTLSDGTSVWLNSGSKLRFPQNFVTADKERIVYLDGEAFFEVAKNKDQPFIVNTQEVDIKVLGTKFNISSFETDNFIATTLVEGSVRVYETKTPENIMQLTPSFQAKYDKSENNFSKIMVDTNVYTAWMQNKLVMDNLKFSEILTRLERRYAVNFVNKAESLNDKIYKGEFMDENIESVLKTISLSTPFNYEVNLNVITLTEQENKKEVRANP